MAPSRILILTPTQQELELLRGSFNGDHGERHLSGISPIGEREIVWGACGFGLIEAAVGATSKIIATNPTHVILAGIAGTYYESQAPVGTAHFFRQVACFEIGIGRGQNFSPFEAQQLSSWNADEPILDLFLPASENEEIQNLPIAAGPLLSVAAVSADEQDVQCQLSKAPQAVAEDMEGYAVAVACRKLGIPLTIIRGISNIAGNRDKCHWKIPDALHAAANLIRAFF